MSEMKKMDDQQLENVNGGYGGVVNLKWKKVRCKVASGYLALRTLPEYNDNNIIAQINNGTVFEVTEDKKNGVYIWAKYSDVTGWVNKQYTVNC